MLCNSYIMVCPRVRGDIPPWFARLYVEIFHHDLPTCSWRYFTMTFPPVRGDIPPWFARLYLEIFHHDLPACTWRYSPMIFPPVRGDIPPWFARLHLEKFYHDLPACTWRYSTMIFPPARGDIPPWFARLHLEKFYHDLPACIWRYSTIISEWSISLTGGQTIVELFYATNISVDLALYQMFRTKVSKDYLKYKNLITLNISCNYSSPHFFFIPIISNHIFIL